MKRNLSDDQLTQLLGMASKQLGQSPNALQAQLQQGNLEQLLSTLDPQSAQNISGLLRDPKALEAMMNNPQIQAIIGKLSQK
jgi:hypothetical protein